MDIKWETKTKEVFDKIINDLPQFHKSIAQQLVKERSEQLALKRNSQFVEDRDLITAFFREVPPAFKDMMKRKFDHLNIDYSGFVSDEEVGCENSG
ncbi:MAG: DUF2621 family protein [Candidatus Omnitrophica bacterium]|nr:DUF2621 family protein [Candidatus Omnitrophota bacterium]